MIESEADSHFDEGENQSRNSKLFWSLIALNVVVLALLIPIVAYSSYIVDKSQSSIPSPMDYLAKQYSDSLPDNVLPDMFVVNSTYRIPASDQASRGTCWDFSTIFLLETQYRDQGIKQGFLQENEYVSFSKQAFAAYLGQYCRSHTSAKVCQYGGFLNKNSTNDNEIEAFPYFLKEIPSLAKSVLPESVCPYTTTQDPSTDFNCQGMDSAIVNNPIKFSLVQTRTVYDLRAIKQLIYSAQRPLGIGTPLGTIDYYIPCNTSAYSTTKQCVDKMTPCPESTSGEFCYVLQPKARTMDGTFLAADTAERMTIFGGHAMAIVGYSDYWQYNGRFAAPESMANMKGAFILHNSWRAPGHSIDYLVGKRTLENEETVCPNHNSPENWIPATLDCMVAQKGNVDACSTDLKRVRGKGRTVGADLLKCTDSTGVICDNQSHYAISRSGDDVNTVVQANGLYETEFIKWSDPTTISTVKVNSLPFWALGQYFAPVNLVANNPLDCGFYAMPYQTLDIMRRRNWDLFDNMKVSDIEVKFAAQSYTRSPESKQFNTTLLLQSTKKMPDVTFDGPIPFSEIYN